MLKIYLPSTILADSNIYCLYSLLAIGCTYDQTLHTVDVDYFSNSIIAAGTLNSADLIVGNLYNPPSTRLS